MFLSHNQKSQGSQAVISARLQPVNKVVPKTAETLDELAEREAQEVDMELIEGLLKNYDSTNLLPTQIDRPLIGKAGKTFGQLSREQIVKLRECFISSMRKRIQPTLQKSS